jgi:hypothetical protein
MRSELIEFFRFDNPEKGMLRKNDRCLLVRGNEPVREVLVPIDHVDFLKRLDLLRYGSQTAEAHRNRKRALNELSAAVTTMLGTCEQPASALQIDLVTNVAELGALPFELVTDTGGRPIFVVSDPPLVLTRRVRRGSHGKRPAWWSKPRVLFAVASHPDAGVPVPEDKHLEALRAALKPWVEPLAGFEHAVPDERSVLHIVRDASPAAIRRAGVQAIEAGQPFTHLHILAHGCAIGDMWERSFGLAMHDDDDTATMAKVSPEELCAELAPIAEHLVVVTLAACDGGNQANSIAGGGSMAHELHSSGIPVVVASQFPLTFDGSCDFTRTFYQDLLVGNDVRDALHVTRSSLYEHYAQMGHDWASLVAYVQLPEDYDDRLAEVRLQAVLGSLQTAQRWSDHLVTHDVRDPATFEGVAERLQDRIATLEGFLNQHAERSARDENLGLLGSSQKRLAELYFHRAALGDDAAKWTGLSRQALNQALGWYERSFSGWYERSFPGNLSHHWTGVQSLALEAVLTGRISRVGQWYAAREAAEADNRREQELWASGTLAELYLLAPHAGQGTRLDEARGQLRELVDRVRRYSSDNDFPVESTKRQFRRYVDWWTRGNGYFGGSPDLADEARQLLRELRT